MKPNHAIAAMEARSVDDIPDGPQWQYEPKWDGFRCILTRDGDEVALTSKSGEDLKRYFPEIVAGALGLKAKRFVLDGEIVVPVENHFSFDDLLQRIHPAASRIRKLAEKTPALYLAFDLLKDGRTEVAAKRLSERRRLLTDFAGRRFPGSEVFRLSPASLKLNDAQGWLKSAGAGSDGVIAKRLDLPYQAGNREGMQKIKRYRTADCVIGGFRYAEKKQAGRRVVGSLLLGLFDKQGLLHHVGFSSAIKAKDKPALTDKFESIVQTRSFTGNAPRWPEPMVHQAVIRMDADQAEKRRRSHLRSFYRRTLSTRHVGCQMAHRQAARPVHHGPVGAKNITSTGSEYLALWRGPQND